MTDAEIIEQASDAGWKVVERVVVGRRMTVSHYMVVRAIDFDDDLVPGEFRFAVIEDDDGRFFVAGDGVAAVAFRERGDAFDVTATDPQDRLAEWIGSSTVQGWVYEPAVEDARPGPDLVRALSLLR